jgi:hypothetical protein
MLDYEPKKRPTFHELYEFFGLLDDKNKLIKD